MFKVMFHVEFSFESIQERKCDSVVDCDDGSDELDCEFLVLNKTYIKDKLPLAAATQGPVQVLHISLNHPHYK